jgi:hypothetical protein
MPVPIVQQRSCGRGTHQATGLLGASPDAEWDHHRWYRRVVRRASSDHVAHHGVGRSDDRESRDYLPASRPEFRHAYRALLRHAVAPDREGRLQDSGAVAERWHQLMVQSA